MRAVSGCLVVLLLIVPRTIFAQDTNFSRGPQYLLTNSSRLFAQPIATPMMSLPSPALEIGASDSTEGLEAGAEDATILLQHPAPPDLLPIYYGRKWVNEIRRSSTAENVELPASLPGEGVQVTPTQGLIQWGYGPSLAEAAAQGRAQAHHAGRTYTNEDIDRLRKSS